jgi:uncharacterized protein
MHWDKIEKIKNTIVEAGSPSKIILFGSYARGNPTNDSDIDLVVIWDTDLNVHERNVYLRRLYPHRDFPLDVFAFPLHDYEDYKDMPGTMLYEATHFGKMIYER